MPSASSYDASEIIIARQGSIVETDESINKREISDNGLSVLNNLLNSNRNQIARYSQVCEHPYKLPSV